MRTGWIKKPLRRGSLARIWQGSLTAIKPPEAKSPITIQHQAQISCHAQAAFTEGGIENRQSGSRRSPSIQKRNDAVGDQIGAAEGTIRHEILPRYPVRKESVHRARTPPVPERLVEEGGVEEASSMNAPARIDGRNREFPGQIGGRPKASGIEEKFAPAPIALPRATERNEHIEQFQKANLRQRLNKTITAKVPADQAPWMAMPALPESPRHRNPVESGLAPLQRPVNKGELRGTRRSTMDSAA